MTSGNKYYEETMLHQLGKLERDNRNWVYYLKVHEQGLVQKVSSLINSEARAYTIHFNL